MQHHHNKNHRQSGKFVKNLCISQSFSSHPDRQSLPLFHPATQSSRCRDEITSDVRWKQLASAHWEPAKGWQGGKLCLPGVVALSWPLMPALHWAPNEESFFYRFAHCFSFSWNSLICTRLHFTWDLCWLLWALGGKQGWQGMRYLWNYNALVSTSTPNTVWHFPPGQLPDGCWSELVSPESGMTRDIPNQLQHAFSCGYSIFKSQLLFTETAACCDSLLLLQQSLVHTLATKTKGTVFT